MKIFAGYFLSCLIVASLTQSCEYSPKSTDEVSLKNSVSKDQIVYDTLFKNNEFFEIVYDTFSVFKVFVIPKANGVMLKKNEAVADPQMKDSILFCFESSFKGEKVTMDSEKGILFSSVMNTNEST